MIKKAAFLLALVSLTSLFGCGGAPAKQEAHKVYFGLFRQGAPKDFYKIQRFEKEYGRKPQIIMWYQDWKQKFPKEDANIVATNGGIPHIVWEPWIWGSPDAINLSDIASGKWDAYIKSWAKDVKAFKKPIFLRFAHEFNIEGYPWGIVNNDQDPEIYITVYRHVVDLFKKEGATNALFVWCPMNHSYPEEDWNDYNRAYPGDQYVDWIGIDGYNWGTSQNWSNWETFEQLFLDSVRDISNRYPTKPIMIAEFGSTEEGGKKDEWIQDIPAYLQTTLSNVQAILYFDLKKESDWRINSSPESNVAFKKIMQNPVFNVTNLDVEKMVVNNLKKVTKQHVDIKWKSNPDLNGDISKLGGNIYTLNGIDHISVGAPTWSGDKDLSGRASFSWDSQNLYFAFDINDDAPFKNNKLNGDIWSGDAIEVAISFDPDEDVKRTKYGAHDFQLGFSPGNGKDIKGSIWNWKGKESPAGSRIVTKRTATGYSICASIPISALYQSAPQPGSTVGFTFAIDDADQSDDRETQMLYSGDHLFYKDPSVWGTATFKK